jgi:hypothetical protein
LAGAIGARWLGELAQALKEKKYQPQAVRRVYIAKQNGIGVRPLSIPTIRDRTAQTAAKLVLEPIFEADLPSEQHGYRPERNALSAVKQVHGLLNTGHTQVVDRHVLHLIKMWLETPVEETDEGGRKLRTTRNRDEKRGIPQGSPLSPLLSNIYMRRFILGWKHLGHEGRLGAHIVSYADDLVICCKGSAEEALLAMQNIMRRLKLTVNERKTHVCRVAEQHFDFLGYTFGRFYSATGRAYLGTRPSTKSVQQMLRSIHEQTARSRTLLTADEVVLGLNRALKGWANYFQLGAVSEAYRLLERYTTSRLRRWLRSKHKVSGAVTRRYSDEYLHKELGLVYLPELTRNLPWAKA